MVPLRGAGGSPRSPHAPRSCSTGSGWPNGWGIARRPQRRPAAARRGGPRDRPGSPLLLADELTAHLDYIQVEEVLRLIRELASGERVVVVTPPDTRMLPLADRVVELMPHVTYTEHEPETVALQPGETLFEQGTMGRLHLCGGRRRDRDRPRISKRR